MVCFSTTKFTNLHEKHESILNHGLSQMDTNLFNHEKHEWQACGLEVYKSLDISPIDRHTILSPLTAHFSPPINFLTTKLTKSTKQF